MRRLTRRQFALLSASAALSGYCGVPSAARAKIAAAEPPRERPNIRYALSTGSWGRVVKPGEPLPLLQILDETAAGGFNGVRLTPFPNILNQNNLTEDQYLEELQKRGLRFSTISFGGDYKDHSQQDDILQRLRRVLALHQRAGATAAVFFPSAPLRSGENEAEVFNETFRFMNRMGKMALEDYGIRMGLHNHTDSLVENQQQVDRFLEGTDPRYVFCAWDTAHLLLGGCDVAGTFRKSLDRIVYTDFKDATTKPTSDDYVSPNGERFAGDSHPGRFFNSVFELGRGEIDFPELMRMLESVAYKGWINHDLDTIRVSCPESWRIAMNYIRTELDPIYQ
jgi:inosose dehydratase